jgi:hypothetical protein
MHSGYNVMAVKCVVHHLWHWSRTVVMRRLVFVRVDMSTRGVTTMRSLKVNVKVPRWCNGRNSAFHAHSEEILYR